ncbi:MAG: hypothetical protein MK411_03185 [SAR202 cluster bacterium]|nr:hypothetical protein [SAR202 cluster bacterium]
MIDMYDIHNHLLPGVDDGPGDFLESNQICEEAQSQNTKMIIATPHRKDVTENHSVHLIKDLVSNINGNLTQKKADIAVKLGMENHVDLDLIQEIENGRALTLNNSVYILVEMPWKDRPSYIERVIADLLQSGLIPVLAHPERMRLFEDERELLGELVRMGCKSQLTASSLYGKFGDKAQRASVDMMTEGLIHVIASDTHMAEGQRCYDMDLGFKFAKQIIGSYKATQMVESNPLAIFENQKM